MRFAEKSVRIGWTFADALKNVRKRLLHKKRDYLFATKDQASAVEYMKTVQEHAEMFNFIQIHRLARRGQRTISGTLPNGQKVHPGNQVQLREVRKRLPHPGLQFQSLRHGRLRRRRGAG